MNQEEDFHQTGRTNFNLKWPAVLLSSSAYIRHWVGQIRGEGSIDVRLQLFKKKTICNGSNRAGPPN